MVIATKKLLAAFATTGAGVLALSACSPVILERLRTRHSDGVVVACRDADAYETIFEAFEEDNPGITVEFKGFKNTEYNQILTTGLTGSDGPDVADS